MENEEFSLDMFDKPNLPEREISEQEELKGVNYIPQNLAKKGEIMIGRPSSFDELTASKFCTLIATTSLGNNKICVILGIPKSTFYYWLNTNKDFLDSYMRAKALQQENVIEDMLDIADKEVEKNDMAAAQMAKLQVETRKFIATKLSPKIYGDIKKIDIDVKDKRVTTDDQMQTLISALTSVPQNIQKDNEEYDDAEEV